MQVVKKSAQHLKFLSDVGKHWVSVLTFAPSLLHPPHLHFTHSYSPSPPPSLSDHSSQGFSLGQEGGSIFPL